MINKNFFHTSPQLVQYLVLLISLITPFAANMFVPSLPALAKHFASSDELMELTITSFLLSFGFSQLIYGPVSDRFGRRKVLFIGYLIALVGSIACALVNSAWGLIIARFILGFGIGAGAVLTRSILRDCFSGTQLARVVAQNSIVFSLAPIAAPLLGGYVDKWFGWEANFIVIAFFIGCTWLIIAKYLGETNLNLDRYALYPTQIVKNYWQILQNRMFLGNVLCAGFSISAINSYNTLSPFLFQKDLGLSIVEYGWITSLIISGMIIGRVINSYLLAKVSLTHIMKFGNVIMIIAALLLWLPTLFNIMNPLVVVLPILLFIIGTSFILPNTFSQSLNLFDKNVGSAGALYGGMMLLISFIISAIVAVIKFHNQKLLALTYMGLAVGVAFSMLLLRDKKLPNNIETTSSL